jgi:para-nitrobenzyl esterase
MKKFYSLITGSLLLAASSTQLNAQCGNRYHDFIFSSVDVTSNIVYGNNVTFNNSASILKLDVYRPTGDTDTLRPLIIFAHGGSFVGGSKTGNDMIPLCTDFAKMGYVTASIDYRLFMTDLPFPGPD